MPTILGLGGSARVGSTTMMALHIALDGARQAGACTHLIDLATLRLPLFNGTYTLDGYTPAEREKIKTLSQRFLCPAVARRSMVPVNFVIWTLIRGCAGLDLR